MFKDCKGLSNLIIGNNVQEIGSKAFEGCNNLTKVILPRSVKYIGWAAFRNTGLTEMYCYAEEVPETGMAVFDNTNIKDGSLYVHESEIPLYKALSPWNTFGNILAITGDDTSIKQILEAKDIKQFFSISGQCNTAPKKGINIIKMPNGQTKKIIVK